METTDTRAALAQKLYKAFCTGTRSKAMGGGTFYKLRSNAPQWMTDAIREAHDRGDILPNDWIYDQCHTIASNMSDTDPADWEDSVGEWADSGVDIYNSDRSRWLGSHGAFASIVDEAVSELGHSDQGLIGDIGLGQYYMIERIAQVLIRAVTDKAESAD